MLCPKCICEGHKAKIMLDVENNLRCSRCYGIFDQPVLEKEDFNLLKISARYSDIYKLPFGYAIDRASKSQTRLGMMMYRIYEKWQNDPNINPDMVINTSIKFILEFSKENAKRELKKISDELIENEKADLQVLFQQVNNLMDKILEMMQTINKIDQTAK